MHNTTNVRSFDVFQGRKKIDTVFYGNNVSITAEEVKEDLINHDGYDVGITVKENIK